MTGEHSEGRQSLEHDLVVVLTSVLTRACTGASNPEDAALARKLVHDLHQPKVDKFVRASAVAAVMAAFPPQEAPDRKLVLAARTSARVLCEPDQPEPWILLGGQALALLSAGGHSDQPAVDFLLAAEAMRKVEQYNLATWAIRRALAEGGLDQQRLVHAHLMLWLVTHDPETGAQARAGAALLPEDNVVRRAIEATVWPGSPGTGDAGVLDSRVTGALRMLKVLDGIIGEGHDDDMLRGLRQAIEAYSRPTLDLGQARAGLTRAIGFWRSRRGLGQVPRAATAGLDAAITLLLIDATSEQVILLCELLEALADAGLTRDQVDWAADSMSPAALQASLARRASQEPVWPDLELLFDRLADRHVLLVHPRRGLGDADVVVLYLRPPGGYLLNRVWLDAEDQRTLDRLSGRPLSGLRSVSQDDVDRLAGKIISPAFAEALDQSSTQELVIVPAGALATVPWSSATVHGRSWTTRPITVAASMSVAAAVPPIASARRRVHAIIDSSVQGGKELLSVLKEHATVHTKLPAAPHPDDVLVIFAHGTGAGLEYRLHLPDGPVDVLSLARARLPQRVILAACRSGGPPPEAFPLAVPTALLLAGATTVVAGLWPLPAASTARILADALLEPESGLADAVRAAIGRSGFTTVIDRAGLAVFGRDDR
ncbi:hypothetical protein AMES_5716 [Amycolatopsis mediterranei S699]|uniref:CHAT domain-containing protein n=2 Tax=Amycolatopsis mediterranei TaxID=33910 RepID=A0A0H3DA69_AMYMU|nr:CHAT domain-containing protein [Amycolatopsis mediterranei]ADJ47541.1 hypothetical protein AMED_5794 [Amycolatopsis mediterranei U32]AEK44406.1 hypothetical protein RAM_29655 [Amycolatopsis mediterranei S699]AFO79252.1 hypothetical protein AMES_5716 [Amycolatopsis mediterranei S699]AGT86380.1 hypothetical protein B737_5716 [Amycolatopsis mediterranei RB]KDO12829.1 hypothetical protein DV26_00110 [Amycolatopsis mediterranei]